MLLELQRAKDSKELLLVGEQESCQERRTRVSEKLLVFRTCILLESVLPFLELVKWVITTELKLTRRSTEWEKEEMLLMLY